MEANGLARYAWYERARHGHAQHEHGGETEVQHAERDARHNRYGVVRFALGRIGVCVARPELRCRDKHKEEYPRRECTIDPLPYAKAEQGQEAEYPDAAVDGRQDATAIKGHDGYQVEQVEEKAEVRQRRPDGTRPRLRGEEQTGR